MLKRCFTTVLVLFPGKLEEILPIIIFVSEADCAAQTGVE